MGSGGVVVEQTGAAPTRVPFDAFVAGRGPALQRTAYLLTGDWALAEDLLQTAQAGICASAQEWLRISSTGCSEGRYLVTAEHADGLEVAWGFEGSAWHHSPADGADDGYAAAYRDCTGEDPPPWS